MGMIKVIKKILLGILCLIAIGIAFIVYEEVTYSPLNQDDFQKLFKEFNGSFRKSCSKDFIGLSIHGEIFDMYRYKMKGAIIMDKDFPKITKWENKEIIDEYVVGKWKNCPLDFKTRELYEDVLASGNLDNVKCCKSLKKELLNPQNHYCYIDFAWKGRYFLLYCTDSQELYYIRKKGC